MIIAVITTFISYRFEISFNVDLTLISIAVIFPLVFTIRGSFRRREKALEHLSQFRASLNTAHFLVISNPLLPAEERAMVTENLNEISKKTVGHLRDNNHTVKNIDNSINSIYSFVLAHKDYYNRSLRDKIFRYMNDVHESVENLLAIHTHRTPISLKAYCEVFIYFFPLIYAPTIISNIGFDTPQWFTYFIVIVTEFILISLFNIQDKLEYPFDNDGLDDIQLENFKLDR